MTDEKIAVRAIGNSKTRIIRIPKSTHEALVSRAMKAIGEMRLMYSDAIIKREIDFRFRHMRDRGSHSYVIALPNKKGDLPSITIEEEIR
jgi:hypothetical protein